MITKDRLERLVMLGVYHNCVIYDGDAVTGEFSERLALITQKIMRQEDKEFKKILVNEDVLVWPLYLDLFDIIVEVLDRDMYNNVVQTYFTKEGSILPQNKNFVCIACDEDYNDGLIIGV